MCVYMYTAHRMRVYTHTRMHLQDIVSYTRSANAHSIKTFYILYESMPHVVHLGKKRVDMCTRTLSCSIYTTSRRGSACVCTHVHMHKTFFHIKISEKSHAASWRAHHLTECANACLIMNPAASNPIKGAIEIVKKIAARARNRSSRIHTTPMQKLLQKARHVVRVYVSDSGML